ncbi:MbtH family protein [Pseudomonas entomophila]|uniref:MbtH family protein n=1 Tax=Pseudomonas sp. RIT-PI-S TaxID=3035295 RepID=UPI0021DAF13C
MEQLNPFDDPQQVCFVLANAQGQYSLWPDIAPIPAGWRLVHGPASREACGEWVELNWQDLTPTTAEAM